MAEHQSVSIYTELTPNPQTMKFVTNKMLYRGKSIDFPEEADALPSPMAQELFAFPFVKAVFIANNFVTVTKTVETQWEEISPFIRQFLKEYLEGGKKIINEGLVVKRMEEETEQSSDKDVVSRIKRVLKNYVQPAVEMDGGAIKYLDFQDGIVKLLLQGSCSGCPSSMITLKVGIEGIMKRMVPEVKEVVAEEG